MNKLTDRVQPPRRPVFKNEGVRQRYNIAKVFILEASQSRINQCFKLNYDWLAAVVAEVSLFVGYTLEATLSSRKLKKKVNLNQSFVI